MANFLQHVFVITVICSGNVNGSSIPLYVCVPSSIGSANPVANTPIGTILVDVDGNVTCQLDRTKYATAGDLLYRAARDPWIDRHKHLLYRHHRLFYPHYDDPVDDVSSFHVFLIFDDVHRIEMISYTSDDIRRILGRFNCTTFVDDIDVHFHTEYKSHRIQHRRF